MAFGIGMNAKAPDAGMLRGRQEEVAVDCWFTSAGKMHLRSMKVKYEDEIRRIDHICILTEEERRYAGVLVREFHCQALVDGREQPFTLLFYPDKCQWKLLKT